MSQIDPLPPPMPSQQVRSDRWQRRSGTFWGGGVLVLVGVYFLLANLGLLRWVEWSITWPVILIAIGLYLVVRRLLTTR